MHLIDFAVLAVIISFIVSCVEAKAVRIHSKLFVISTSIWISYVFSTWYGENILLFIKKIDKNLFNFPVVAKIIESLLATIGTTVVFVLLFVILKQLARFVNGEINSDIRSVLLARLLGALDGLFIIVGFKFSFTRFTIIKLQRVKRYGHELGKNVSHNSDKKMKFVANLN
ncbi:MAG: hypothetical protein E7653_00920 [Ruminococcaceae bacterium]|nr:hypothetical protein [Oscillospiraceae bacterium]